MKQLDDLYRKIDDMILKIVDDGGDLTITVGSVTVTRKFTTKMTVAEVDAAVTRMVNYIERQLAEKGLINE